MSPAVEFALSFVVPALKVTVVGCVLVGAYDFGARKGWWPA